MSSVAGIFAREAREDVRRLSVDERLELAFRLGEEDLEAFRVARGLNRSEALRQLQLRRQKGRRRSGCMLSLLE